MTTSLPLLPMITESLKRSRPGVDCLFEPPAKKALLLYEVRKSGRHKGWCGADNGVARNLGDPEEWGSSYKRKRHGHQLGPSSTVADSDSHCEVLADSRRSKRQRISEDCGIVSSSSSDSESENMHITSVPPAQSAHPQNPGSTGGRKGKRKNKNRKKADQKEASTSVVGKRVKVIVEEPVDSNYNELNYWRPILPDIEGELARFLQEGMDISDSHVKVSSPTMSFSSDEEVDGNAYNSFNFWRDPIPEVDLAAVI